MKKKQNVKIPILITAIITAVVFISIIFLTRERDTMDIENLLLSMNYNVEIFKEVSYQGYDSEKIFAQKDNESILLRIVKNIEQDSQKEVLEMLNHEIYESQRNLTVFFPYIGQEMTLSIPEEFRPVKKETEDKHVYYIVNANEIFSLKTFTESEIAYKGLFSTYYCENESKAYRLEVYHDAADFDEDRALYLLSLFS